MAPFELDNRTLSMVVVASAVILTAALGLSIWPHGRFRGPRYWVLGSGLYGLGFFLLLFQGLDGRFVSIILANLALVGGLAAILHGLKLFVRDRAGFGEQITYLAVTLCVFLFFTYVRQDVAIRIVAISLVLAVISFRCGWVLQQWSADGTSTRRFLGVLLFYTYGGFFVFRTTATLLQPSVPHLFAASTLTSASFLAALAGVMCWTIIFITMVSSRIDGERRQLISDLQKALAEVKTLRGLVPICANCKKVRDDQGFWQQVEKYVADRSHAQFSHSICPECVRKYYPEFADQVLAAEEEEEKKKKLRMINDE